MAPAAGAGDARGRVPGLPLPLPPPPSGKRPPPPGQGEATAWAAPARAGEFEESRLSPRHGPALQPDRPCPPPRAAVTYPGRRQAGPGHHPTPPPARTPSAAAVRGFGAARALRCRPARDRRPPAEPPARARITVHFTRLGRPVSSTVPAARGPGAVTGQTLGTSALLGAPQSPLSLAQVLTPGDPSPGDPSPGADRSSSSRVGVSRVTRPVDQG